MTPVDKVFAYILSIALGSAIGFGIGTWLKKPTTEELRLVYTAYQQCMEQAPICHMEVEDFIQYYQIKEELEL